MVFVMILWATLNVPSAKARLQVFLMPEKAASVKRLDAVLGQVYLHSWCFIVVRHGGQARRGVYCPLPLRRVAADLYPLFHKPFFQGLTDWDLLYKQFTLCVTFPFLEPALASFSEEERWWLQDEVLKGLNMDVDVEIVKASGDGS